MLSVVVGVCADTAYTPPQPVGSKQKFLASPATVRLSSLILQSFIEKPPRSLS
jgi:hypothetical protein